MRCWYIDMKTLLIVILLVLAGCDRVIEEGDNMNHINIKVRIGEPGLSFLQRNNIHEKGHIDVQPAGTRFYEYEWSVKARGTVQIEHGERSFNIPYALGFLGIEKAQPISGMETVNISAGLNDSGSIDHNDARQKFMEIIKDLRRSGWQPVIHYNHPRLNGEEAFKYYLEEPAYGLPLDYMPGLAEWMEIGPEYWRLYADGVFLDIKFYRDKKRLNLSEPGAYLLSFGFRTAEQKAKDQFEGEDRDRWQALWTDRIKQLKTERYAKEAELIKRGFTIYTDYPEPRIHPADPVEP